MLRELRDAKWSNCPRHDLQWFDWNKEDGTLTAEASDLGTLYSRLYADGLDEGFEIYSPKTGKVVKFVLTEVVRDREGDILSWIFEPATALGTVRKVIVFND